MTAFQIIEALTFKPVIRLTEWLAVAESLLWTGSLIPPLRRLADNVQGRLAQAVFNRPGFVLCCLLWAHCAWAVIMLFVWLAFGHPETAESWCGNAGS